VPDCHTAGRYQRVWRRHFYDGLQAALPSAVLPVAVDFGWARPASQTPLGPSRDRDEMSERLWDQIRTAHAARGLDAVISYCFSSDVDPALIERTVELGVPWINFFCDSTYAFDLVEALARVTSLNWFPERAAAPLYRAAGRPVLCRPYAMNPAALPEAISEGAEHALGFVGAPTGNRVLRLAGLRLFGCRTEVRGEGWQRTNAAPARPRPRPPRTDRRARGRLGERILVRALMPLVRGRGRPLTDDEMAPFLSRCRVVLGLNEGRDIQGIYRSYLKLRDVEFPGYGCCYLTQHNEDVAHAFEVGREVLTFRHVAEAASLVRRSVRHPEAARAMGQAARRRVLAEHTWAARLLELARAL
jgi:glycosyl transferase family 1